MGRSCTVAARPLALLAALLAVASPGAVGAQSAVSLACKLEPGPSRTVAAIVDGETVRLDDGIEVRLIGALAPQAADLAGEAVAGSFAPETATRDALHRLVAGRSVALAFAGLRTDRHGRVLAHLFINEAGTDVWVQGRLVEQGLARAYALPGSDACIGDLLTRERTARAANLGLWAHAAYQIRPADRPSELARYVQTFQLVRGRIERRHGSRALAILDLSSNEKPTAADGTSQRGAFRVVWRRSIGREVGLERAEPHAGRNVLARGWIDVRRGPQIEIVAAGQIELED